MKVPIDWIRERLTEPSTYRGLTWLLTAAGITVSPSIAAAIAAIGMAAVGLIDALTVDEKNR